MGSNEKKGELHFDGCQIEYEDGKSNFASYRILEKAPGLPENYFAVTPILQFKETMSIKAIKLKTLCIATDVHKVHTVLLKQKCKEWKKQDILPKIFLPNKPNENIIQIPLQVGGRESFVFVIDIEDLEYVKFGISGMLYVNRSIPDGNFGAKFYLRHTEYNHCQKDVDQAKDTPILHINPLYLKLDSSVEVTLGSEDTSESRTNHRNRKAKVAAKSKVTVDVQTIFEDTDKCITKNFALNLSKHQSPDINLHIHERAENIHLLQKVDFKAPAITDDFVVRRRAHEDRPRVPDEPEIEVKGVKYILLHRGVYVEPSLIKEVTAITKSQQPRNITDKLYEGYMNETVPYKVHVKLVAPEQTKLQLGMPVHENVLNITAANTLPDNENIGFLAIKNFEGFKLLSKYIKSNSDGRSIPNSLDLGERKKIILQIIQALCHLGWGKKGFVDVRLSKIYCVKGKVKLLPPLKASETVEKNIMDLTALKKTCEHVIQIGDKPEREKSGFHHLFDTITNLPSCVSKHFFFLKLSEQRQFIQEAYKRFQPYHEIPTWTPETCKKVLKTKNWKSMFKEEKDGILYYTAYNTNKKVCSVYNETSCKSLLCFYRNVFTHCGDKKKIGIPELQKRNVCYWYIELGVDNADNLLVTLSNKFPNFLGYIYDKYHKCPHV
ncbi:uncharacterized protein LOC120326395 [Styela clava]